MAESKTSAKKIRGRQLEVSSLELRKQGYSYRMIAAALNVSEAGAFRAVSRAIARLQQDCNEAAQEVRALEAARLDEAQTVLWPLVKSGDLRAIETYLRVSERRAKLFGLDAPTKSQIAGDDGGPLELSISTARERLAALVTQREEQSEDSVEAE